MSEQKNPQVQPEQDLSQQAAVRRQKLADMREAGFDPFTITKFPQDAYSADLKEEFAELTMDDESGKSMTVKVVGSQESDFKAGAISEDSPVGKALKGARVGQTVVVEAPRGAMRYTVDKIER